MLELYEKKLSELPNLNFLFAKKFMREKRLQKLDRMLADGFTNKTLYDLAVATKDREISLIQDVKDDIRKLLSQIENISDNFNNEIMAVLKRDEAE